MALSLVFRNSLLKGPALKTITNQLLRSSSVCVKKIDVQSSQPLSISDANRTKLLSLKPSSPILSKYFSATSQLRSAEGKPHDHVTLWKLERALSVVLLPLIPAALISPSPLLDTLVAVSVVMHTHWGLEAIVVDYIRPIIFGPIGPKVGMGLLYVFSAVTLAGCLNLIFNDIGLANAFLELWKL